MGRTTVSMIGGIAGMTKGAVIGAKFTAWIPVVGAPLAVATGSLGGLVGYLGGSKDSCEVCGEWVKISRQSDCEWCKISCKGSWKDIWILMKNSLFSGKEW